jgi:hypothetical protein
MGKWADLTNELAAAEPQQAAEPEAPTAPPPTPPKPPEPPKPEPDFWDKTLGRIKDTVVGGAPAFAYGAARGATLGAVDRLVGIGTQAGEAVGAALPWGGGEAAPKDTEAGSKARQRYLAGEDKASQGHGIAKIMGEVAGGAIPAIAMRGARAAAPWATLGIPTMREGLAATLASPAAKMAGQGAVAGAMNERSDNLDEQAKAGLWGAALGAGMQTLSDAQLSKIITGANDRMGKGLRSAIVRNEETGAAADRTAQRHLQPVVKAATDELRTDPILAEAARTDAARAGRIVESKLDQVSELKHPAYAELDAKVPTITFSSLEKVIREAAKPENASDATEKRAFEGMHKELTDFWLPKWQGQGRLIPQEGKPMGVASEGVRAWLTKAQRAAANTLGQINESDAKAYKDAMKAVASQVWHKHLDAAEELAPAAVAQIRQHDSRVSALLSMEKIFKQRADKESGGAMGGLAAAGKIGEKLGMAGMAATAWHSPGMALSGLAAIGASHYGPRTARAFNDAVLVPLQKAAERGTSWGEFARMATEKGLPQSTARALYDRISNRRSP